MDTSKKRWDHKLQAWVLDLATVSEPQKYWDAKDGKWKNETPIYASGPVGKEQTVEVSSCAVPTRQLGPGSTGTSHSYPNSYTYSNSSYRTVYPWEKLDREKWPNTWWALVQMYFASDWHVRGRYIDTKDWDARLRGEYRKEPTYPRSYYDYDEC